MTRTSFTFVAGTTIKTKDDTYVFIIKSKKQPSKFGYILL